MVAINGLPVTKNENSSPTLPFGHFNVDEIEVAPDNEESLTVEKRSPQFGYGGYGGYGGGYGGYGGYGRSKKFTISIYKTTKLIEMKTLLDRK
jgi:hypothetical protein